MLDCEEGASLAQVTVHSHWIVSDQHYLELSLLSV
jgi:hypothetical protein